MSSRRYEKGSLKHRPFASLQDRFPQGLDSLGYDTPLPTLQQITEVGGDKRSDGREPCYKENEMAQDNQAEIATETRASSAKKRALQEKNVEAPERPAITAMRQAGETAVEIAVNDAFRPGARWFFSTLGGTGGVLVGLWLGKQVGITTPLTR